MIELLVVVAIIGLLASIITTSLTSTRVRSRDTRRVSDLKQIKSGMDLYFATGNGYPDTATWNANIGKLLRCDTTDIMTVPNDPISPAYNYTYTAGGTSAAGCGGTTVRGAYTLNFYIESKTAYYTMDEDGKVVDSLGNTVSLDSLLK